MNKALVVIFHKYPGMVSNRYRILFEYFQKNLANFISGVDTLYLVDSNDFFPQIPNLPISMHYIPTHNFSHAQNIAHVYSMISEDAFCLIDQDTIFYQKDIVTKCFNLLNYNQVVSYIERADATHISRFAPYCLFMRREILPESPDFAEHPELGHLDPFAKLTHEILAQNYPYHELFDDRSTIQLTKSGIILKNPKVANETGIYHIRNFYGGLILLETYKHDLPSFHQRFDPMPAEEITRLLGWLWLINDRTRSEGHLYDDIRQLVSDELGILSDWDHYIAEFRRYHAYF